MCACLCVCGSFVRVGCEAVPCTHAPLNLAALYTAYCSCAWLSQRWVCLRAGVHPSGLPLTPPFLVLPCLFRMAEEVAAATVEAPAVEVAAPPAEISVKDALKAVLLKARIHDGLKRGLHECAKVLDKGVARLCVLATNCDVDAYKKLVKALCESKNIPIIEVETHALLGEWCGLCKLDKEGNARKVAKCSVAVVTDFGESSHEVNVVLGHVKKQ